ncbi:MAG: hypothetical protein NVSMB9_10560 [Isosphaeraceae bacterium]
MRPEISIRRADTIDDYRACQEAQRLAWGIVEEDYVVPLATLVGAQKHGGLVLGAFRDDGEALGMSFAFLGRIEGRLGLYSQLTGVVPGYQDQGIGFGLKMAQREFAQEEQLPCIAWTFDPLQSGNARFNLERLGGTAGRYLENLYGARTDALNRNTTTDRLLVVWEMSQENTRAPRDRASIHELPCLIVDRPGNEGRTVPSFACCPLSEPRFLLPIPVNIGALRVEDPDLAAHWGLAVREAFHAAFAENYRVVGFVTGEGSRTTDPGYVLERLAVQDPTGFSIQRK